MTRRYCPPGIVFIDVTILLVSIAIAFTLRFDSMPWLSIFHKHIQPHMLTLPLAIGLYVGAFSAFRLYRCAWRFASLEMLWNVVYANSLGLAGLIVIQAVVDGRVFPRSVIIITWGASILLTGGMRVLLRVFSAGRCDSHDVAAFRPSVISKRVLILGAGIDGVRVLKVIREDRSLHYKVVGFLDDDPKKQGMFICNCKVLGPLNLVKQIPAGLDVDEIIVALPEANSQNVKECVMECRKRRLPVKVVPQLRDVLAGRSSLQLVDISVEDLLRRPLAITNFTAIGMYLTGKRVLVTGAGGSIGSEICRQIASLSPASLILLGHGENSIHQIYHELLRSYPDIAERIHCVIASIAHEHRINSIFNQYKPQFVFHAAAHKHVPLMEANEQEAVYNNILGTHYIAQACGRTGVEKMVMISTDKAAQPCCVMGATKWLCEESVRAAGSIWGKTSFITVRFGNVLGSRGSVIPIFYEQIMRGGPVTVTHPEMTRYFMTIPEAVRLVIQSGSVGWSGDLFLFDMGDPVRIVDLAEDMIRLCGLEPYLDVKIKYTGIRPGERLHEQLTSPVERIEDAPYEGLSLVHRPQYFMTSQFFEYLKRLEHSASHGSAEDVRNILSEVIPGWCYAEDENDEEDASEAQTHEARLENG